MANTNTYLVNNIGHWQGLEELLVGVHENQVQKGKVISMECLI